MRRVQFSSSIENHGTPSGNVRKKRRVNLRHEGGKLIMLQLLGLLVVLFAFAFLFAHWFGSTSRKGTGHVIPSSSVSNSSVTDIADDEKCSNTPLIRPSGVFVSDPKIYNATSPADVTPPFNIGSIFSAEQVTIHMGSDVTYYKVIRDLLRDVPMGVTFDIGANQGFFTYYLATLGYDVHSFEINSNNFNALQHGTLFNPVQVANRVHLYSMGISDKIGRFQQKGQNYGSFLKTYSRRGRLGTGSILSTTFDCFVQHVKLPLSHVPFVKIDVEGFEISVLKGARHTLAANNVEVMLMEVGPARWSRSGTSFPEGVEELRTWARQFRYAFLSVRRPAVDGNVSHCHPDLALNLSDVAPRAVDTLRMHVVLEEEWKGLLLEMKKRKSDCNFLFTNV
eukprot:CAMPEP_0172498528 /NCGR_PEP_ID=MMETSP1066-20121228/113489_1 /TAXON_ID=671091 /ORGANISM="Coscinodiscus wailesii, Strain CCMP2513" /LENGTH=393 /DNA_ID=CAMNT_0013271827 /DNA_START=135 /DNA_END=1316 /DNA_ORIENTATION=-